MYNKVTTMLQDALTSSSQPQSTSSPPVVHTMLDLLLLILPFLPVPSKTSTKLFEKALSNNVAESGSEMIVSKDAGVQKRTYRVVKRLIGKGVLNGVGGEERVKMIVERLGETREGVAQGAQRVRNFEPHVE